MNYYLRKNGIFEKVVREPVFRNSSQLLVMKHSLKEYGYVIASLVEHSNVLFMHPLDCHLTEYKHSEIVFDTSGKMDYESFLEYAKSVSGNYNIVLGSLTIQKNGEIEIGFEQIKNNGYINSTLRTVVIDEFLKESVV